MLILWVILFSGFAFFLLFKPRFGHSRILAYATSGSTNHKSQYPPGILFQYRQESIPEDLTPSDNQIPEDSLPPNLQEQPDIPSEDNLLLERASSPYNEGINTHHCPKCGNEIPIGDKFCIYCGFQFQS